MVDERFYILFQFEELIKVFYVIIEAKLLWKIKALLFKIIS